MARAFILKTRDLAGRKAYFHGRFHFGEDAGAAMKAEVFGVRRAAKLDASTDYLVLSDVGGALQKKAQALNKRGATVRVMDVGDFTKLVEATGEEDWRPTETLPEDYYAV